MKGHAGEEYQSVNESGGNDMRPHKFVARLFNFLIKNMKSKIEKKKRYLDK